MTKQLPALFREKMIDLLGENEFEQFLESYDQAENVWFKGEHGEGGKGGFFGEKSVCAERGAMGFRWVLL